MDRHHDITLRQAPTPDDEGEGVTAIIQAFIKNPMGAVKIIAFVFAASGLWYSTQHSIDSAKADSEQHYKDLSAAIGANNERVIGRMETLVQSDTAQAKRIEDVFARGDLRWGTVQAKLNETDVKFARLESAVNYIVRIIDKNSTGTGVLPELSLPGK